MRHPHFFRAALMLALVPCTSFASSAIVPDAYSGISAAIASGADTVVVRDGVYPDSFRIQRSLVLMAALAVPYNSPPRAFPAVGSITIVPSNHMVVAVNDVHVDGYVRMTSSIMGHQVTLEGCRIDDGLIAGGGSDFGQLAVRGCIVFGGLDVFLYYPDLTANTVVGTIAIRSHGTAVVRGNFLPGPAAAGIQVCCADGDVVVDGNQVTAVGIGIDALEKATITANTIDGCGDVGIQIEASSSGGTSTVSGNVVRHAGADGILVADSPAGGVTIRDNRIEDAAGHGIRVGRAAAMVVGNTVLRSASEGIVVVDATCRFNVIGRSNGAGLVSTEGRGAITNNTSYANAGAGYHVSGSAGDSISNNIAYSNAVYSLVWTGSGTPAIGCNDWFLPAFNAGVAPGATDLLTDPRLCDVAHDRVSLHDGSPCANAPGCGLIGAVDTIGCQTPLAVSEPRIGAADFELMPIPSLGAVFFRWESHARPAELSVYDVAGHRVWRRSLDGNDRRCAWDGVDANGRRLPPGTYYALLRVGATMRSRNVVLLR